MIRKIVKQAGVKNPDAITSTKLRKHLATMSQVINLSEQDLDQLAEFMGRTSSIHKKCYRLPNDVYQTAKISKLLLLNETGQAPLFKGKTLDEIDVNLDIIDEDSVDEVPENFISVDNTNIVDEDNITPTDQSTKPNRENKYDEIHQVIVMHLIK